MEAFAQVEQQGLNSGRESKKAVDGKTEHSLKPKTGNEKSRLSLKLKSVPNTALEDSLRLQGFRIIAGRGKPCSQLASSLHCNFQEQEE